MIAARKALVYDGASIARAMVRAQERWRPVYAAMVEAANRAARVLRKRAAKGAGR